MSITAYPFDSQVTYDELGAPIYDRPAGADLLRTVFSDYFTNGVMTPRAADALQVVADTGMALTVKAGAGVINGAIMHSDSDISLTLDAGDSLPRIDRIVLRLDDNVNVRGMGIHIVKGVAASSPTAPALTRTATVYELALADIAVGANVSTIVAANITDQRHNRELCGACGSHINIDTLLESLDDDQLRQLISSAVGAYTYTATIGTSWNGNSAPYTQIISVPGVLATDNPVLSLLASDTYTNVDAEQAAWGEIYRIDTADGNITVYAHNKTTRAINVLIRRIS